MFLGRVATPEQVGEIGVFLGIVPLIAAVLDFGGTSSGFRFAYEKKKFVTTKKFFSRSAVHSSLVLLIFIPLGLTFAHYIDYSTLDVIIALLVAWALALNNQITSLLRARKYFRLIGVRAALASTITLSLFVAWYAASFDDYVTGRLGMQLIALVLLILPFAVWLLRNVNLQNIRKHLCYIRPIAIGAMVGAVLAASIGYSNRFIVSFTHSSLETGVFVFAASVASLGLMLNQIVNRLYQPLYFETASNPISYLKDKLDQRVKLSLFISFVSFASLILSFDFILLFLNNPVYGPILTLGPLLVGAVSFQLGYHIFNARLHYEKRQSLLAYILFLCATSNLLILYIGATSYGLRGIAIASCLSALIQSIALIRFTELRIVLLLIKFWLCMSLLVANSLFMTIIIDSAILLICVKAAVTLPILWLFTLIVTPSFSMK